MKRFVFLLVMACLLSGSTVARDYGMGVRAGTQGVGVEGAVKFKSWFTLRGGLYRGSVSGDFEEGDLDYDGELTVGGAGLMADFFPMRGKFRLTAGMFSNDNEIELDATPTTQIEIGDNPYEVDDIGRLDGQVEFDSSAPYLGIGWGNVADGRGRFGFVFDVGALFQGSPEVSLVRTSTDPIPGIDEDIEAELQEIEDDVEDFEFWPVVSFGLAIRF